MMNFHVFEGRVVQDSSGRFVNDSANRRKITNHDLKHESSPFSKNKDLNRESKTSMNKKQKIII